MKPVTNSEMKALAECPWFWKFIYHHGLEPIEPNQNFALGNEAHKYLEDWYRDGIEFPIHQMEAGGLMQIMMAGYWNEVIQGGADSEWEVLEVESLIEAEIDGVHFRGLVDLKVRDKVTGQLFLVDHKTGKDFSLESSSRFNHQMRLYMLIDSEMPGENVSGVYLNMLKKSMQTSRAKPPFYKRHLIAAQSEQLLAKDRKRFVEQGKRVLEAREAPELLEPRFSDMGCKACKFKEVCWAEDNGTAEVADFVGLGYNVIDPDERYSQA